MNNNFLPATLILYTEIVNPKISTYDCERNCFRAINCSASYTIYTLP